MQPKVFTLLAVALFAEIGYAALNLSTMPVYLKNDRHFGEAVIGLVLTAFLLSEALLKGVMGSLADRFGPKRLMILGPAITVVTTLISLLIPHQGGSPVEVLAFVVLRALDGVGLAMLWPAAFSQMNSVCEDSERHQAMSLLTLCYLVGIALAFPFGGFANDLTHTRYAGLVFALLILIVVVVLVALFVDSEVVSVTTSGEEGGIEQFLSSAKQIPEYLLVSLVTFGGVGFPTYIFKLFPIDQFHFTETQVGTFIFPGAIAMALISVPLTKFGESLGLNRAVQSGLFLCTLGMALIGIGAIVPFLRNPIFLAIGGIPVGLGFLLAVPAWMARVSEIDPTQRASNIGAVMMAQGIGAILGAPVGAVLYEKFQPLGAQIGLGASFGRYSPFLASAICVGLGWMLSLRVLSATLDPATEGIADTKNHAVEQPDNARVAPVDTEQQIAETCDY